MAHHVLINLEGRPRAGQYWADKILKHLTDLDFCSLHHEACLYIGNYASFEVLVCRQSDDFMFAGVEEPSMCCLATLLGKKVNFLVAT
jgi:hypothetical protein